MKTFRCFAYMFVLFFAFSCANDSYNLDNSLTERSLTKKYSALNGEIKVVVISDPHLMAQSLLVKNGSAFQTYLAKDPKLLEYSSTIFEATIQKIITQKPDLVLISGDLTKDGEMISHETVARMLRKLTLNGIKVVVTIGNHDVNNPESYKYIGDKTVLLPNIKPDRIPQIYADFGFRDAIAKDPNSLSFVSEPIKDLWIISIDANKYDQNVTTNDWSGAIKSGTMTWIKEQLADAQLKGKTVIGMMHHGLVEHYTGEQQIDPGYVVDNWEAMSDELIDSGLKIIFTGHYHATDITKRTHGDKFVFDIETGSLVSYPCTYRMLTINGDNFAFEPQTTTNLLGPDFDNIAKTFQIAHLDGYFQYVLANMYSIPEPYAGIFAPYFENGAMAHFAGDETPTSVVLGHIGDVQSLSTQLGMVLGSLWTDINTPDNTVTINMATGAIE